MASIVAVLLACMSVIFSGETYKRIPHPSGPLVSSLLFMIALCVLLCKLEIYPASLRKLGRIFQTIIEMFIAAFIADTIYVDFWFPLEASAMEVLNETADSIEELVPLDIWDHYEFCTKMRSKTLRYIVSYIMSSFFFVIVLHATRAIDLRAFEEGSYCFFHDIAYRIKRSFKLLMKSSTKRTRGTDYIPREELIKQLLDESCCGDLLPNEPKKKSTPRSTRRRSIRLLKNAQNDFNNGDGFGDRKRHRSLCNLK